MPVTILMQTVNIAYGRDRGEGGGGLRGIRFKEKFKVKGKV